MTAESPPKLTPGLNENAAMPATLMELISTSTHNQQVIPVLPNSNDEYRLFAAACNFSNVATILYIIRIATDNGHFHWNNDSLTIFIVGAFSEITLFTSDECWLFTNWLPSTLKQLQLYFIGPELPFENLDGCHQTNTVTTYYIRSTYEEFCQSAANTLIRPSLIVCFNCGFAECEQAKLNPWVKALDRITKHQKNMPIAFTSYTNYESKADNNVLKAVSTRNSSDLLVLAANVVNPYRDYRPYRNTQCDDDIDEIYYYNGYLSVVIARD